jgi:hypothetical protein
LVPQPLNTKIREYFGDGKKPVDGGAWLGRSEIPTSAEVLDMELDGSHSSSEVELKCNRRKGVFSSKGRKLNPDRFRGCGRPKSALDHYGYSILTNG